MSTVVFEGHEVSLQVAFDSLNLNLNQFNNELKNKNELIEKLQLEINFLNSKINSFQSSQKIERTENFSLLTTFSKFCGTSRENIHFFFAKLEQARLLSSWNDNSTFLICKQMLDGEALMFISCDPRALDAKNYDELKSILIDRYKLKFEARYYRQLLHAIKIKDHESIEEFADRIRSINIHTYEHKSDNTGKLLQRLADERALDSFLLGLGNSKFSLEIRLKQPETFAQAVTMAIELREAHRDVHQIISPIFNEHIDQNENIDFENQCNQSHCDSLGNCNANNSDNNNCCDNNNIISSGFDNNSNYELIDNQSENQYIQYQNQYYDGKCASQAENIHAHVNLQRHNISAEMRHDSAFHSKLDDNSSFDELANFSRQKSHQINANKLQQNYENFTKNSQNFQNFRESGLQLHGSRIKQN